MNVNALHQPPVRRSRDRELGQSLVLLPIVLVALLGMCALVIDLGNVYYCYEQLLSATQAAALAGADALSTDTVAGVQTLATQYSAAASQDYNSHPNLTNVQMVSGYPQVKCLTTTGITCFSASGGNAVVVQESATVNTLFARVFGVNTVPISVTATAGAKGGSLNPYNVVLVLDTTASMNAADSYCGGVTQEQCALGGLQTLLKTLSPCASSGCGSFTNGVAQYPVDQVALMAFPGLTPSETSTLSSPPVQAPTATKDYTCPTANPSITSYNNNPGYLILPFQSNYRTADTNKTLNASSDVVIAAGGSSSPGCQGVQAPGGEGTFYAGAINAAQSYLTANSSPNIKNVMSLLSDGDANATGSDMNGKATTYPPTNDCHQAITSAANAKTAGTLIYSVSYGSETTGCNTDTGSNAITPCQTMFDIASTPQSTYFFSQIKSTSGTTVCAGARSVAGLSSLNTIFTAIGNDLSGSRLIPNGTT